MKQISTSICLGLGDNIVARIIFDSVKDQYSSIRISHEKRIINIYKRDDKPYLKFLNDIGNLLFTEPPYVFDQNVYTPIHTLNTVKNIYVPNQPNLQHLLCKGDPLILNQEYIVMTTKIRGSTRNRFYPLSIQLWKTLNKVSEKYKIVLLGERVVEKSTEYVHIPNIVFGIYDQIISNIPSDRLIDLTIPALGIAAPELSKIQQDALIMKNAKYTITLGLGGNVWLAGTAGKVIGYRDPEDGDVACDILFNPKFTSVQMTKDWGLFIKRLEES